MDYYLIAYNQHLIKPPLHIHACDILRHPVYSCHALSPGIKRDLCNSYRFSLHSILAHTVEHSEFKQGSLGRISGEGNRPILIISYGGIST